MRAILVNIGSLGDVQPFLALAVELRKHGHDAIVGVPHHLTPLGARLGVPVVPIGPDIRAEHEEIFKREAQGRVTVQEKGALLDPFIQAMPQALQQLSELCQGADVLICSAELPLGRMIHELTGIPYVSLRTSYYGPSDVPEEPLVASLLNPFRAQLGLPPLEHPLTTDGYSAQLALFAMSPQLVRREPDWPDHFHITGYFLLDEPEWQPSAQLSAFLAAGPPPVVISMGSMVHEHPAALTDLLLGVARQLGQRVIIQPLGSGASDTTAAGPDVYLLDTFVPYGWLFPQTSCVVHHGGTGTTAWTLWSGVPAVHIPHLVDQLSSARTTFELGCAGPPVPYPDLTAGRLHASLAAVLSDPRYRTAAASVGASVRAERGLGTARQHIEQLVAVVYALNRSER